MAKKMRTAFCLCLMIVVFSGTAFIGAGAAERRSLPDSFLIGDMDGIQVSKDGTYCVLAEDLEPGDVVKKHLVIQNLDQGKAESVLPYTLTMLAEPLEETGPVKLLDMVHLELKLDGRVIYSGPCRGNAPGNDMTRTPLNLGVYEQGDRRDMEITLIADGGMPVAEEGEEQSVAYFAWHFYAARTPPSGPGTDESTTAPPATTTAPPGQTTTAPPGQTTLPPGSTTNPFWGSQPTAPPGQEPTTYPPGKSDPFQPPKTGDLIRAYAPYEIMAVGMMLFCFALVLTRKKRERDAYDAWLLNEALDEARR